MPEAPRPHSESEDTNRWRWAPIASDSRVSREDWRMAFGVVMAAAAVKILIARALYDVTPMAGDQWAFGYEVGHIAGNIARGRGFAIESPGGQLLTTAWLSPLYPLFLAGLFKVFGLYSLAAAHAILVFNCLFQALTSGLLFLMGSRISGRNAGLFAAGLFLVNPNGWQFVAWAWPSQLFALLLALHFYCLLFPARNASAAGAMAGATFALALLTDGAAITVAPVALIHFAVAQQRDRFSATLLGAVLSFAVVMAPWTIRNYQQFDTFNPLRGNAGINLWVGNHPEARAESFHGLSPSPWHNAEEAKSFAKLGERDYDRRSRDRAIASILDDPALFLSNTTLRFTGYWLGEWWEGYRHIPWYHSAGLVALTLMAGAGAVRARRRGTGILLVALLFFGAPYYLTVHGHGRYRVPIEPLMCLAAALPGRKHRVPLETEVSPGSGRARPTL